jgi:hypothetical protein
LTGPAGWLVFNQQHFAQRREEYEKRMRAVTVPVFTNAVNAGNFHEIYLYSGPVGDALGTILGAKGRAGRREVLKMDLDRLIASGARAPMLAPIRVHLGAEETRDGRERDEFWMEGALRLIRFFARSLPSGQTHNFAELLNRYLEVIFTAPLEKEIETINAMSRVKRPVEILDPTDGDPARGVPRFHRLVEELDLFSHFDALTPAGPETMFEQGREAGEAIVAHYGQLLPTVP